MNGLGLHCGKDSLRGGGGVYTFFDCGNLDILCQLTIIIFYTFKETIKHLIILDCVGSYFS